MDQQFCTATSCSKRAWHKGLCNYHAIMSFYHEQQGLTGGGSGARSLMQTAEMGKRGTTKNGIRRLDTVQVGTRARASPRG
jgi:hypothetical protein